jgi:hypothetical protein
MNVAKDAIKNIQFKLECYVLFSLSLSPLTKG